MIFEPAVEKNILIVIGIIVGFLLGIILYFSYSNSFELLLISISLMILLYSSLSMSYILKLQDLFNERDFNINFGSDLLIFGLAILFTIFFSIKFLFLKSNHY